MIGEMQKGRVSNRRGAVMSDETKQILRVKNLGRKSKSSGTKGQIFKMSQYGKDSISIAGNRNNIYDIMLPSGAITNTNGFRDYCFLMGIKYKHLHQWSKKNINNKRVHPSYGIKIIKCYKKPLS